MNLNKVLRDLSGATIRIIACLSILYPVIGHTEAGDWMIRTTIIGVIPDTDSKSSIGLDLDADDEASVAVDGTYFFTNNIALNVLATFLSPDIDSDVGDLGSVDLIPPIFTLQYHFSPGETVSPYVGIGFNYNIFYNESGQLDALDVDVENTFGFVVQAGMDYGINENLSFNLDLKYLTFDADVDIDALGVEDELEYDAFIIGAGLGYRF